MPYSFSPSRMSKRRSSGGGSARYPRSIGRPSFKGSISLDLLTHTAQPLAEVHYEADNTFNDFNLDPRIAKNLEMKGYTIPTAIQDQGLPLVLDGHDVVGLANTGTGKTAVFLLPIINASLAGNPDCSLIVVPTRELATQIFDEFKSFASGLRLSAAVCVGGESMHRQIQALRNRPHLIIGTPGRLKDLIQRGQLPIKECSTLVLDEVDRMLDMGFIDDIRFITGLLPVKRQSMFFSATMTTQIKNMTSNLLTDPKTVSVLTQQTSSHIGQSVVYVASNDQKQVALESLLAQPEVSRAIVFGSTKFGVEDIATRLDSAGIKAATIHGNKNQMQRSRALEAFKRGRVNILIATDVASRGLDIADISHVINFDLPNNYDDYIHRIGRTGRAGQAGQAVSLVVHPGRANAMASST